jgi:MerR family transcriptional regulator, redox-sensitive transcriptional activator SoxR
MPEHARLSIGELSKRTGLAASALRFYESLVLLEPAQRRGGQRRYDERAVQTVRFIRLAQSAGLTCDCKTLEACALMR